jgi:hypothetical protein
MESLAANPERPLVEKISETGEGSWTNRIRDKMNALEEESSIDFSQYKWTHAAAHAFEEMKLRLTERHAVPDAGARVPTAFIAWLLYLLPAESLDLNDWFGTDGGMKLYTCGRQPFHLDLYGKVGTGVRCDGAPSSTDINPDCEKACTRNANCFAYTLNTKSGQCEMWDSACDENLARIPDIEGGKDIHTYRRQVMCYHTGSNEWLPHPSSLDHTGVNPLLVVDSTEDVDDIRAEVSKFEDLFGSTSKVPPREDGSTTPWIMTERGNKALTALLETLTGVEQGVSLQQETVESILDVPGMDLEEWMHDMNPFVTGPNDWDAQVYLEEKQMEEFTNPREVYQANPNEGQDSIKGKMVIYRTTEKPDTWQTGVITNVQVDPDKTILGSEKMKLGDYTYQILAVKPDGNAIPGMKPDDKLRWQTNWFDPRGKWKNAGCEGIDVYQEWEREAKRAASSLLQRGALQVRAHGGLVRQHKAGGRS